MKIDRFKVLAIAVLAILLFAQAIDAVYAAKSKSTTKPNAKTTAKKLPKLLDLGATKCIPCKMMAPILEELAKEYKGQLEVEFIDVWKNPDAAEKYKIRSIPTQIFFDAAGKEFFRHIGFFSKEDILKTFEKHGIKLKKPAQPKKTEQKK
jgi:thioredoxin 1